MYREANEGPKAWAFTGWRGLRCLALLSAQFSLDSALHVRGLGFICRVMETEQRVQHFPRRGKGRQSVLLGRPPVRSPLLLAACGARAGPHSQPVHPSAASSPLRSSPLPLAVKMGSAQEGPVFILSLGVSVALRRAKDLPCALNILCRKQMNACVSFHGACIY